MGWIALQARYLGRLAFAVFLIGEMCRPSVADEKIVIPVRWVGIAGAPSVEDPQSLGASSTDIMLWQRHERPTDAIYLPMADVSFRSAATKAIKDGPVSFPVIRDPSGAGGNVESTFEYHDARYMAERAWKVGDILYLDDNNNGIVDSGVDTMLTDNNPLMGFAELGHAGTALLNAPDDVRFVDGNGNNNYDFGETIYRDENSNGFVDNGDTRLNSLQPTVGAIGPGQLNSPLLNVPSRIKFVDLIREPANTFNIGNPEIKGIIAISANEFDRPDTNFPTHGTADGGCQPGVGNCPPGGLVGMSAIFDDPGQYLPPGPNYRLFETQLVGHEFGHVLALPHGDSPAGGGPAAIFPNGDPYGDAGTRCDSNNMMQYCWLDLGTPGDPEMVWVGEGDPSAGVITEQQRAVIRGNAESVLQAMGMGGSLEAGMASGAGFASDRLVATRVDVIGEVPEPFGFVDVAHLAVAVDETHTELSLQTRRPLLSFQQASHAQYVFALDVDGNSATGGPPAIVPGEVIPTDYTGAEYVVAVRLFPSEVIDVKLFEHDPVTGFTLVDDPGISAVRNSIKAVVEGIEPADDDALKLGEEILVTLPNGLLLPFAPRFNVEYLASAIELTLPLFIDRARIDALNFDEVSYPDCTFDRATYRLGEEVIITASDLLPNSHAHLLFGDMEIGEGLTDDEGSITMEFTVPLDAKLGERLVTIGTLAVTADCFLLVVPEPSTTMLLMALCPLWRRRYGRCNSSSLQEYPNVMIRIAGRGARATRGRRAV